MRRIDSRTVELLPGEVKISDAYEDLLSEGFSIRDAANRALPRFGIAKIAPRWIKPEFVEYLSDGTMSLNEHREYTTGTITGPSRHCRGCGLVRPFDEPDHNCPHRVKLEDALGMFLNR